MNLKQWVENNQNNLDKVSVVRLHIMMVNGSSPDGFTEGLVYGTDNRQDLLKFYDYEVLDIYRTEDIYRCGTLYETKGLLHLKITNYKSISFAESTLANI